MNSHLAGMLCKRLEGTVVYVGLNCKGSKLGIHRPHLFCGGVCLEGKIFIFKLIWLSLDNAICSQISMVSITPMICK